MKKILLFVFYTLIIPALISVSGFAADKSVIMDNCDSAGGWMNGPVPDTNEFTEGRGSIAFTAGGGADSFVVYKVFGHGGINASGMNALEFDLFFSDCLLAERNSYFAVEISSSGTWDSNEIEWGDALKYADFKNGWNHIELPFKNGNYSDTEIDLSDINFIRIFMLGIYGFEESAAIVRLDNIILTDRGGSGAGITEQVPGTASPVPDHLRDPEEGVSSSGSETAKDKGLFYLLPAVFFFAAGVLILLYGMKQKKPDLKIRKTVLFLPVGFFAAALILLIFCFSVRTGTEPPVSATKDTGTSGSDPYAVFFREVPDTSLPHVLFGEIPVSGGMKVSVPGDVGYPTINIKGYDSWILEKDRKADKSILVFTADEDVRAQYSGQDILAVLYYYIGADVTVSVSYEKADGTEAEVTKDLRLHDEWHKAEIRLDDCVLRGGIGGGDIKFSLKTMEMLRLSSFGIRPAGEEIKKSGPALVTPVYESRAYTVADTDVRYFGAAGDGKTDDTAAFKDAVAYAASLGGGTVFVPEGRYAITSFLDIPTSVSLVGELEPGGSVKGSVLCAYYGKNDEGAESFIRLGQGSSFRNFAIYYPEQCFAGGKPIPYPYTIEQTGVEGVDIENIVLVNSYNGIDFGEGNDSLQTVRHLYGTPLNSGYIMNACWDIARIENIRFSPEYWLNSGFENIPDAETLKKYMLANTVGMTVQRVDWTYFADIGITGCYIGLKFASSADGAPNGHIYGLNLSGCFYGLYADSVSDIGMMITGCTITTDGGEGSAAVYCSPDFDSDITFNSSSVASEGRYAVYNGGTGFITMFDSVIRSAGTIFMRTGSYSLVNVVLDMPDKGSYKVFHEKTVRPDLDGKYIAYKETKPSSAAFADLSAPPYSAGSGDDITAVLQAAIDSLRETGGLVYIPAGYYYVSGPITVHAGTEIRGSLDAPHFNGARTAQILTDFGRDDPGGEALFTLYGGAGMRGVDIFYYNQKTSDIHPYSFTIRGKGSGIYLCNLMLSSSYNGVDFASYRCDSHYIEYIWGAPAKCGIVVGSGSENGVIRDVHYTPNCWRGEGVVWEESYRYIMAHSEPFVIGDSKGQILYHNFVYGAFRGLTLLGGAKEAHMVAHGVDSGNFSLYAEGGCTAELVNTQLVNLNGSDMNYIFTDESFSGTVNCINTNMWGTPKDSVVMNGKGKLGLFQGTVLSAGNRFLIMNAGEVTLAGIHVKQRSIRSDIAAGENIIKIISFANIFGSGGKFDIRAPADRTEIK